MRDYIEVQIIKKANEFFALVQDRTKRIKKYSNFLEAMREDSAEIMSLVALGYECYSEKERIECYERAIKLAENVLFYARLFSEYQRITGASYKMIKCQGDLLIRLLEGLIKVEKKNKVRGQYLFNLKFAK
ncbi:MAG: hypothetical protein Q7S53_00935 [bacterium]|nr:hypothetical protein [bacterium]